MGSNNNNLNNSDNYKLLARKTKTSPFCWSTESSNQAYYIIPELSLYHRLNLWTTAQKKQRQLQKEQQQSFRKNSPKPWLDSLDNGIIAIITKLQPNQLKRSYLRLDLNGIGLSLSPEGLHLSFSFSLKHFLWMLWSSGWQKLAAIRLRQKWPWKFSSSTYLLFLQ